MQRIQNFKLVFKNKNGLFSNIAKNIYNLNGHILNSKYNQLVKHSELDMNVSIPKKNVNLFNNYLLDMNVNTLKNVKNNLFKIKIYCSDNSGIIHSTCEKIENINGRIIKMDSNTIKAPISSTDLFEMEIITTATPALSLALFVHLNDW